MKIVRIIFLSMIISGVIQLVIVFLGILPEMQSKIWGVNVGVITFFITYISFLSSVHFQNKDVQTIIHWIAEMLAWIMIFVVYGMIQATFYYLIIHGVLSHRIGGFSFGLTFISFSIGCTGFLSRSLISMRKRLLILTDTTSTQVNGVTRCIEELHTHNPPNTDIYVVSADDFTSIPFPGYKEIRLSLPFPHSLRGKIDAIRPDYIHIKTEGPIGMVGAYICKKYRLPYTTTFHTKFPEYLNIRNRLIKEDYVHRYLHYIHDDATRIFISNSGMLSYLREHNYGDTAIVPLGINHTHFFPGKKTRFTEDNRIVLLFVGRIAVEKNIEDFLSLPRTYRKIVVGDGPQRTELAEKYSDAEFLGVQKGSALAEIYRSADVFIFPSHTDTLGLVNLEAMACGKPVIAYDIENMRGIITSGVNGVLVPPDRTLDEGIAQAQTLDPHIIAQSVQHYRWNTYAKRFFEEQISISPSCYPIS